MQELNELIRSPEGQAIIGLTRPKIVKVDPAIVVPTAVNPAHDLQAWVDTEREAAYWTEPAVVNPNATVLESQQWHDDRQNWTRLWAHYRWEVTATHTTNTLFVGDTAATPANTILVRYGTGANTAITIDNMFDDNTEAVTWGAGDGAGWWAAANVRYITDGVWREWQGDYWTDAEGNRLKFDEQTHSWSVWNESQQEREARHQAEAKRKADAVAEQERRTAEWQARAREAAEKRKAADLRAEAMLRRHLSPEQEADYFTKGYFDLVVEGGKAAPRHYRIERSTHGNVKRLENGVPVERFCIQPAGVPTADANLAQLLHLLHREADFRRVANITRLA